MPKLQVIEPASIAGEYLLGTANFTVSHCDTCATRNLLLEPAINVELTQSV